MGKSPRLKVEQKDKQERGLCVGGNQWNNKEGPVKGGWQTGKKANQNPNQRNKISQNRQP